MHLHIETVLTVSKETTTVAARTEKNTVSPVLIRFMLLLYVIYGGDKCRSSWYTNHDISIVGK